MRLSGTKQSAVVLPADRKSQAQPVTRRNVAPVIAGVTGLEVDTLRPAQAALRDMSDFDEARVEMLRTALKEGRIPFDAAKLAGLIQRFHGAKG
ncbi:flagellar biosynthesis anti-sigma factor FlgM [Pandoraea apista]|uniref:flagellar biosynthesis anti-sigma factor FlgM n=1 Tax=Pandoraea apista TaxID=93218 RepID=UPI000F66F6B2|nr:flagellar biosynthesis anti-sigma factor FlgM [Pandoraea apista]RRW88836.1 flagellar biosynthesis anti-sigma factor FlgM [Pandoraea apista]RRW98095.1 flagellar biosynthesis anti-sigma factor FlgM [Pandoraea apista]